jgi:hypothetical protein
MNQSGNPKVTVATERLTPEEERHLSVAIDLFLAEMVRQQLGHDRERNEEARTERQKIHRPRPV